MCNENEGKKERSYTSGHRSPLMSNPNFSNPIAEADTKDEGTLMSSSSKDNRQYYLLAVVID